jgi:hypothetical protein
MANDISVGPDLVADFGQVRVYVLQICWEAHIIWAHCEETISFIFELRESCTGEPRSNYIHDCFNRLKRISAELMNGPDGEGISTGVDKYR